ATISNEVKFTAFLQEHNLTLEVSAHAGLLFRSMFPDKKIAEKYGCAVTKTTAILNGATAPDLFQFLIEQFRVESFALAVDGSSDVGLSKMFTLRVYDKNRGKVESKFWHMCLVSHSTAEGIFENIKYAFSDYRIPWRNCVALLVDNAAVNVGKNNSLSVCFKVKNESIYVNGCPCRVLHNAAQHASKAFTEASIFLYRTFRLTCKYYFQGCMPRQVGAAEFAGFCDQEYWCVLKYASTRWLSMELAVTRVLKQYHSLKSYFDSQATTSDLKLTKLKKYFHDPMTEVCLFFYQSVLPIFSNINLVLQKESPQLHHMVDILESFDSCVLMALLMYHSQRLIQCTIACQITRVNSDILEVKEKTTVRAAKEFMVAAFRYSMKRLPLIDVVAHHVKVVDFAKRATMDFSNFWFLVKNFEMLCDRFGEHMDSLDDEFVHCQQLSEAVITKCANVSSVFDLELDSLWDIIGQIKAADGTFPLLFEVTKFVLVLPHSNVSEECILSYEKNHTDFRPNLSLDKTLPSILTCKINHLYHIPCHKFKPSNDLLCKVKAAMNEYNTKKASLLD
uniref:DUF4371 domain-containing protein n=1 Tax=Latimeria chalumnae TaxID=7897 RepID=H3AZH4_LATCH